MGSRHQGLVGSARHDLIALSSSALQYGVCFSSKSYVGRDVIRS